MTRPLSSKQRVAQYLGEIIDEGETFTMNQVRYAIPDVNQIDRRMRELRELGWRIDTYKTDPTLSPEELRVTKVGDRIWEPGAPKRSAKSINSATRREVFARDRNTCQSCGIHVGEEYSEYPGTYARMTIGHYTPKARGGDPDDTNNMRTECSRCNEASRNLTPSTVDEHLLRARIDNMARKEKATIARWLVAGKRDWNPLEVVWSQLQQLPVPVREDIARSLAPYL